MEAAERQALALQRFRDKCEFDPGTGCVLWAGGTTAGRGNSAVYGAFWYEGRRWFAHRWAAVHIHGLPVAGMQVGHCCPSGPNTLCVQHLTPQTVAENMAEMHGRRAEGVAQTANERQFWLFVSLGLEPAPAIAASENDSVPFFTPPKWLVDDAVNPDVDCPF